MLKHTTETRFSTPLTGFALRGRRCLLLKRARAILQLADAVRADGNAKEGRSTSAQGGLATADWRAGHDPVLVPDARIDERTQAGRGACIPDLGAAEDGEGCDVHQDVAT